MEGDNLERSQEMYLIPANSKKGLLIMGMFHPIDLIIFGIGVFFTVLMVSIFNTSSIFMMIIVMLPALVTGFLITPVAYSHNVLTVITLAIEFYSKRQKFKWKGWSFYEESNGAK